MSGKQIERQFKDSCTTIDYPCTVGKKYIDPCDCGNWYECGADNVSFLSRSCANGTFYDHVHDTCDRDTTVDIILKLCYSKKPWERCINATTKPVDLKALEQRCTEATTTTTTITTTTNIPVLPPAGNTEGQIGGGAGAATQPKDISGAIVGSVIAAIVIIVIIAALAFLFKKKGKPLSHYIDFAMLKKMGFKDSSRFADYDNNSRDDPETYAEIADVANIGMNDPTYGNPDVPTRPSFTSHPALGVNSDKTPIRGRLPPEDVAYDNPGYDKSNDNDDETILPATSGLSVSQNAENPRSYTPAATTPAGNSISLEVPQTSGPSSFYTRGPNPTSPATGDVQATDGYQVPRAIPDYCDLEPESSSVIC